MSFLAREHKTLKVLSIGVTTPTSINEYNVGTISKYEQYSQNYYLGSLTGYTLVQHTRSNDTFELDAGRYIIRSTLPAHEPFNDSTFTGYIQWQIFSSSSLNGTYTATGTKGKSQPGYKPNDTGDNGGVHSFATAIVESSSTLYVQTRIVDKVNYLTSLTGAYLDRGQMIIWRAD